MNSSPTLFITLGMLLGVVVGAASAVVAQTYDEDSAVKPSDYQSGTSCDARATKHLIAATDPNQRDWQEWNLNTAAAYRELAAQGFQEC